MEKELEKKWELEGRICDALVLAYSPSEIIAKEDGRNFYIPSKCRIEEAFGNSLRKIFGKKDGGSHWADSVEWNTIANLEKLEKRILKGTKEIICGNSDYQNVFDLYLSSLSSNFEHVWVYWLGDLYQFNYGKREEALEKFQNYWTQKEKGRWNQIHKFMREDTKRQFKN